MTPGELLPQVYHELRKLAAAKLACERPGHTLNATALVHEAYLKLGGERSFACKGDYLKAAAVAMRRILADRARAKLTEKRGGGARRMDLGDVAAPVRDEQLLAVSEAIDLLAAAKPEHAQLIELRFFGGLTGDEAADAMGISPATGDRMWRFARAWLQVELQSETSTASWSAPDKSRLP
jgi:RNA polymerase sigma factor (TIGR02999 family)